MEEAQRWAPWVKELFTLAGDGSVAAFSAAVERYASAMEGVSVSEALLETRDAEKQTVVHFAAQAGNNPVLTWMAEQVGAAELVAVESRSGLTPLMCAIDGNHLDTVRLLLTFGADAYHLDAAKITPIHCALRLPAGNEILPLLTANLQPHENLYVSGAVTGSLLTWSVLTNNIPLFKKIVDVSEPVRLAADCLTSTLPCAVVASAHFETAGVVLHYLLLKSVAPDTIAQASDQQGCSVLANLAQLDDASLLLRLVAGCSEECLRTLCARRAEGHKTPYQLAATEAARAALLPYTTPEGQVDQVVEEEEEAPRHSTSSTLASEVSPQTMVRCEQLKSEANKCFSQKRYAAAEQLFDEAFAALSVGEDEPGTTRVDSYRALVSTVTANQSVTALRLGHLAKAEKHAKLAIRFAPEWYKGYYRLAMVKKAQQDFEEATQQMYECLLRNGQDENLQREFKLCLEKAKAQHAAAVESGSASKDAASLPS